MNEGQLLPEDIARASESIQRAYLTALAAVKVAEAAGEVATLQNRPEELGEGPWGRRTPE